MWAVISVPRSMKSIVDGQLSASPLNLAEVMACLSMSDANTDAMVCPSDGRYPRDTSNNTIVDCVSPYIRDYYNNHHTCCVVLIVGCWCYRGHRRAGRVYDDVSAGRGDCQSNIFLQDTPHIHSVYGMCV